MNIQEKIEKHLVNEKALTSVDISKYTMNFKKSFRKEIKTLKNYIYNYNVQIDGDPNLFNDIRVKINGIEKNIDGLLLDIESWIYDFSGRK